MKLRLSLSTFTPSSPPEILIVMTSALSTFHKKQQEVFSGLAEALTKRIPDKICSSILRLKDEAFSQVEQVIVFCSVISSEGMGKLLHAWQGPFFVNFFREVKQLTNISVAGLLWHPQPSPQAPKMSRLHK